MLFWTLAALMTAAVASAILWPILRRRTVAAPARAEYDAEVYAAQLRELEADRARGIIAPEDAALARAEIGRRLLKATHPGPRAGPAVSGKHRIAASFAVFAAGLGLPAASLLFYQSQGSPALPDLPLAARLAVDPAEADPETLMAQAEAKLRENPDNGAGWEMIGPIYLRAGRAGDAIMAMGNAIRLLGPTAAREAALGEAQRQVASGEVTDEAKASFERALALDPAHLPSKFFLALDLSQEERFAEAGPAWRKLIAESPKDAPWLEIAGLAAEDAERRVGALDQGAPQTGAPAPGPTGGDIAAAADMREADRRAMIEGMVSGLAARLKSAPNDPQGWKRLLQSYTVLGDAAKARSALADATAAFADGSPERGDIERFAASLGLTGRAPATTQ